MMWDQNGCSNHGQSWQTGLFILLNDGQHSENDGLSLINIVDNEGNSK